MKLALILAFLFLNKISCLFIPNQTILTGESIQDEQSLIQNTTFLLASDNISWSFLQIVGSHDLILPIEEIDTLLLPSLGKITLAREALEHTMIIDLTIRLQLTSCIRTIMLSIFLQESVLTNSSLSTSDTRRLIYQQQTIKMDDMIVFFLPTRMQTIHRQNAHNNEISISILLKQRRRSRTQPFFKRQKAVRKSDFGAPLPVDSFKAPPSVVKDLFEEIKVKPKNDETNEFHEKLACRLDDFFNQLKGVEFIILLYFDDNEHDTSKCPVPKHYDHVIHRNTSSHSLLENSKYDRVSSTDFRLINAKAYWINTEKTIKRRELREVRIEGVAASNATFVPTTIANSAEIRDCVKLTWHNVLHHSIFGRPTNFCHS